jgi:hypothetical protein
MHITLVRLIIDFEQVSTRTDSKLSGWSTECHLQHFLKEMLKMVEGHIFTYEAHVSQAERENVESVKAMLCCMCRLLMLLTSQCLCPELFLGMTGS